MSRIGSFWVWLTVLSAIMMGAMLWLTRIAHETERRAHHMACRAELDQTISIALWRADSFVAPIVGLYSALPSSWFRASQTRDGWDGSNEVLLAQDYPYVLSRFHRPASATSDYLLWDSCLPDMLAATDLTGTSLVRVEQNRFVLGNGADPSEARQNNDLINRNQALQQQALQQQSINFLNQRDTSSQPDLFGPCKPIWRDNRLFLARRVLLDGKPAIEGIELDWRLIQINLTEQIADLLPTGEFRMVDSTETSDPPGRHLLASLPVQLVVPDVLSEPTGWTPLRMAVVGGWLACTVLVFGLAWIGWAAIRVAETRSAFVSAVTHELRSPLTTVKIYSELLQRGMVDERDQNEYINTLCRESNRLDHLINNVLTFSRLKSDRSNPRPDAITISNLLGPILPRLQQRAALDGYQIQQTIAADAEQSLVRIDREILEQILYNLVDNACKYSKMEPGQAIGIEVAMRSGEIVIRVIDSGNGIRADVRKKLFRPFSKSSEEAAATRPGVGLGLSLCKRLAEQNQAKLSFVESPRGCTMELRFRLL